MKLLLILPKIDNSKIDFNVKYASTAKLFMMYAKIVLRKC
jgi:hypothetical protein